MLRIIVMPKMFNVIDMKQFNLRNYALALFYAVGFYSYTVAQVGINTTSPNGILEVANPTGATHGIVLPRVALTATNVAGPVLNPQGGALAVGTVVYNTTTTTTGSNDVYPGIYVWTGTEWFNKFTKKHQEYYTQSSFFQPDSNAGWQNVPGLTSQTFTANYTGAYKIEVSMNYGSGYINDVSAGCDVAYQQGQFRFNFNGTNYYVTAKAQASQEPSGTRYYAIWEQYSFIEYVSLVAGTDYTFTLSFDQANSPGFVNNGNSGSGLGYMGIPDHVPCSVEFTYIGE